MPFKKERLRARNIFRQAYDVVRTLPDRMLHQRRHQDVLRRISRGQRPKRILVVCHGNICRSPYMHAVLQRSLGDVSVTSAGVFGSGRPVPEVGVAVAAERGLDLSGYRSRPLTASTVAADLVVVMDSEQATYLARMFAINPARIIVAGDLDPKFRGSRAITDPFNRSREVFESAFDRLDRCAATLVTTLPRAN